MHAITRYRPAVDAPSRAVVREGEAARGPGLALAGSTIAIDPDRIDADELDLALAIASELSEELTRLGARPLLLRKGSEPAPVDERIRRANAGDAAALISIAVGSGEQVERGSACFHYGTPTTHSPMGRRLAESIQDALVRRLGLPDGGLHPRSIAILRETRMPAARIEPAVALDERDASRIGGAGVRGRRGTRHRGRRDRLLATRARRSRALTEPNRVALAGVRSPGALPGRAASHQQEHEAEREPQRERLAGAPELGVGGGFHRMGIVRRWGRSATA